jgi:hypothetical protein
MIAALAGWNGNRAEDMRATISAAADRQVSVAPSSSQQREKSSVKWPIAAWTMPCGDEWRPKIGSDST